MFSTAIVSTAVALPDCALLCLPGSSLFPLLLESWAGFPLVSNPLISGVSHLVIERVELCSRWIRILMRKE